MGYEVLRIAVISGLSLALIGLVNFISGLKRFSTIFSVILWHSSAFSAPALRAAAEGRFATIGLLAYRNIHQCSATVLSPTTAVTAKNCFTRINKNKIEVSEWSLHFPPEEGFPRLTIRDLQAVILDDEKNNLAYIVFPKREDTRLRDFFKISTSPVLAGDQIVLVGFSEKQEGTQPIRVRSQNCTFTGKVGEIHPRDPVNSIAGHLSETTCPASIGMFGGPTFLDSNGRLVLVGVTTQTSHLTEEGWILESFISKDQFGEYVKDVLYSQIAMNQRLAEVMNLDPALAVHPRIEDINKICGYSDIGSLWQKADQALAFFRSQQNIDPLFWEPDGDQEFKDVALAEIRETNTRLAMEREKKSGKDPWLKPFYRAHQALLSHPALASVRAANLGQLEITSSDEICDGLGCSKFRTFSIASSDRLIAKLAKETGKEAEVHFKRVMAHELGHFVLEIYRGRSGVPSNLIEAGGSLKDAYHLTVDAIGARLAHSTAADMANTIEATLRAEIFGEEVLAGDASVRLKCLRSLPTAD